MEENRQEFAYLITHSYGEVIDGITYDEESAKYFVDKMNEKYKACSGDFIYDYCSSCICNMFDRI